MHLFLIRLTLKKVALKSIVEESKIPPAYYVAELFMNLQF